MGLSLTEDIKSVSEFKKQIRQVFTQLHRTGRPVVITVNGRADIVLLDAAVFERKLSALNLHALLAEGEADVAAGRIRPARAALRDPPPCRKDIALTSHGRRSATLRRSTPTSRGTIPRLPRRGSTAWSETSQASSSGRGGVRSSQRRPSSRSSTGISSTRPTARSSGSWGPG